MAFRTFCRFKIQSTNVPQPLVGSWISACPSIGVPSLSPLLATLGTMANAGTDASQIFVPGDPVWLIDPVTGTTGANPEPALISAIAGNVATLGIQTDVGYNNMLNPVTRSKHVAGAFGNTTGSGTFILLKQMVNNLYVQPQDGNVGPMYLGSQINFTADFRRIVKILNVGAGVQPIAFNSSESSPGNPYDTSELWILGTANDTYSVSLNVA